MINILLYVTIITIILIWAIWDCFEISHITKYHQFIIPHLLEHQHRKTLLTLILGSNGLMLVLKPYLQSYPLTLVCLALLVMSVQDLLTGYVNILFAWAIFF
ncbi:hypothetical protein [Periweissella fabalis]|uniref:Uncharacterized protein n=1 Tax=Periweissella fabalis TaxID=1070421 RepID=A0A7X6N265_9LACO|nr:hypothetical protein [Periweissella fabalis]MCM0599718.1 hypothetical protein [Periweissella fabalis]NKZ24476.1 hypothetical protein [Periweissella fabalis]